MLAVVFFGLAFATPASAITINGVDYVFLANKRIGMGTGPTIISGAVGVNDPNGILDIGTDVHILGLGRAHKIDAGRGSFIDSCEFDIKTGPGVCTTSSSPFVPITAWPPLPIAAPPACVVSAPNVTVANGATLNLAPGCYGLVTVGDNATLNLVAGNYQVLDLHLSSGATIDGNGPTSTIVTSKKVVTFQASNLISDIRIQTPIATTSEVIQVGSDSQVNNAILYAPFGKIHVHLGSDVFGSEVVANTLQIESLPFLPPHPDCGCLQEVVKINGTTIHVRGLNLSAITSYMLKTDCNGSGGIPMDRLPGGSATDQDLTVPNGTTCADCHVAAVASAGTFCSATSVTLP
jgi:hypothetical protein